MKHFTGKMLAVTWLILLTGSWQTHGQPLKQLGFYEVKGNVAIHATHHLMILGGGEIIDISDPSRPSLASKIPLKNPANTIRIAGDHLFFGTDREAALEIYNIANPLSPLLISSLKFPEAALVFSIGHTDSLLYLTLSNKRIYAVDIRDLHKPVVRDTLHTGWVFDMVVQTDLAYVAGYDHGLQVIRLGQPGGMEVIASAGQDYYSIEVHDTLAFLGSDSSGGVDLYSIADPMRPYLLQSVPATGEGPVWDLAWHRQHLFAATRDKGMNVYEIISGRISLKTNFPESGNGECFALCLHDSLILLSTYRKGIAILTLDTGVFLKPAAAIPHDRIYAWPNPATRFTELVNCPALPELIHIYDIHGTPVKQLLHPSSPRISLSGLSPGIYLLDIVATGWQATVRIVIQ